MRFDCGTTSEDFAKINRLRRWRGALDPFTAEELAILAQTPGIPLEWLYRVFRLGDRNRIKLRCMIAAADLSEAGAANAVTVRPGDGLTMLALAQPYSGAAPVWAKFDLQQDPRPDAEIAAELKSTRQQVQRWRTNHVFSPLTLERLIPMRGPKI